MWRYALNLIFAVMLIQVSIPEAACDDDDEDPWFGNTYHAVSSLQSISYFGSTICYVDEGKFDCYMRELTGYLSKFENFLLKSRLDEPAEGYKMHALFTAFRGFTDDPPTDRIEQNFLRSSSLKSKYDSTVKPLMQTLKEDIERVTFQNPFAEGGYALPLQTACSDLPPRNFPTLSVKDVCPTLSGCSSSFHSSTDNACDANNKCDKEKAIPLMIGVLFYKVSFAFVDKFCSERCSESNGCSIEEEFASITKQVNLMKAFVKMLPENPFEEFFREAVTRRAYSQIVAAMDIISENEEEFDLPISKLACEEIEAEPGCQITRFYPHYLLLKKMKEESLNPGHAGDTRDLTLYENVDHAKIIELKKEAIKHNELLSAIQRLNDNLEAQVRGISSYFKGIANFEQGIANADVDFIRGKLNDFDARYNTLKAKVKDDVKAAMDATIALTTIRFVEDTIALVAKIAEESNPIAAIFTGVDSVGIRDQAVKVAEAAADLAHIGALAASLGNLANNTRAIGADLQDNRNQITKLITLVNEIKNNTAEEISNDAEVFINEYAGYTPRVDRSRMARNIAMWGAFRDSTCDILNDVEGVAASAGKAITNGFLLCENLEGTIAEFDALRENIFDFQFELVDSLARVVRGDVAKKLADSIQTQQNDMFKADQLMAGFLMTQIFIQSQARLYCDKLEYRNEGRRIRPCSPETGVFTNSDLDNLVAYTDHQTYISIERTVHIPSKPQYSGDLGFINIHTFARDKTASFRLPRNVTWLYQFDWGLIGESHASYVENFQLFLPNKEYKTGADKLKTSTRIVVTADTEAGSYISADESSTVLYKLPEQQASYVTVYQEGYRSSTCPKEIPNPYSLCDNLPKICHTSANVAGDSLLPTTLSRWRVTYSVQSGHQEVEWLAPNSTTDLYLIAKVTLRMLPRQSSGSRRTDIVGPDEQQDVCCQGNTYRSSLVSSECTDCPNGSTKNLGGYYCEGTSPDPNKKHHVFVHRNSIKRGRSSKEHTFTSGNKITRAKDRLRTSKAHHSKKLEFKLL